MDRLSIDEGLVASLSDDFDGAQFAVLSNIRKRLSLAIEHGGIRITPTEQFSWSASYSGGDAFQVNISAIGLTVFKSEAVFCPDEPTSRSARSDVTGSIYVMLKAITVYDEAGEYMPGYPDGVPAAQGDYTRKYTDVECLLSEVMLQDPNVVLLYRLDRSGTTLVEGRDYRPDNAIVMRIDIPPSMPAAVQNVNVSWFSQASLVKEVETKSTAYCLVQPNKVMSPFNSSTNAIMARIAWDALNGDDDVWGYEIRLVPRDINDKPSPGRALKHFVLASQPSVSHEAWLEIPERVGFDVYVRAIDDSIRRQPGAWSAPAFVRAGVAGIDIPAAPTLAVVASDTPFPPLVDISTTCQPGHLVQIFWVNEATNIRTLVHEGSPGTIKCPLPYGQTGHFVARSLHESVISSWSPDSPSFGYSAPAESRRSIAISFPVEANTILAGGATFLEMRPPFDVTHLRGLRFISSGSVVFGKVTGSNYIHIYLDDGATPEVTLDLEGFPFWDHAWHSPIGDYNLSWYFDSSSVDIEVTYLSKLMFMYENTYSAPDAFLTGTMILYFEKET